MLLKVDSYVIDRKQIFKLGGVLDYSTVDTFDFLKKTEEFVTELEVDFSELDFIDSTGIGAILSILHSASSLNAKVIFVGMSEDTKQLFETIGVFEIKKSLLGEG